jgi:predicted AAA+ superfamily ATPase
MPFNANPTGYFPSIVADNTGITIPYSNFESYKSATSGDIREFGYSFLESVADTYLSLSAPNKSSKFVVARTASIVNDTTIRKVYTVTVDLNIGDLDVVSEPS